MERTKMPREDRAKQFAPFDALKGLQDALRLKEYEHEKKAKGDMAEEGIMAICAVLGDLEKGDFVKIRYFYDGHEWDIAGASKVDVIEQYIEVNGKKIKFDDILEITKN